MSKKDYIAIAELLNEVAPDLDSPQFAYLVGSLGDIFQADNPNFDRYRFEDAVWKDND